MLAVVAVAGLGAALALLTAQNVSGSAAVPTQYQVAEELTRLGVQPGARVARIGGLYAVSWARLAGLTVVAEVPRNYAATFFSSAAQDQADVIRVFRSLGVKAIVFEQTPSSEIIQPGTEWRRLNSNFYALVY
jgi:hypothetical protein